MNSATPTNAWIEQSIRLPHEAPGDWITVDHRIAGRLIRLAQPRDPDQLLDDPAVQRENCSTDYMPYWGFVWPGALLLADRVLKRAWPNGTAAVEIGCGLGLAGLAGLAAGLHVTFTDYSPAALSLAEYNARLNGFANFTTQLIDWQNPPPQPFPVVLGADVLYEARCLADVLRVLDRMLGSPGVALLADPNRAVADSFEPLAQSHGYQVRCGAAELRLENRQVAGRIFQVEHTS